jgi:hypothetical protein
MPSVFWKAGNNQRKICGSNGSVSPHRYPPVVSVRWPTGEIHWSYSRHLNRKTINGSCLVVLVVTGTMEFWMTCSYIGNNNPNWRTHIFQRGFRNHQPGRCETTAVFAYERLIRVPEWRGQTRTFRRRNAERQNVVLDRSTSSEWIDHCSMEQLGELLGGMKGYNRITPVIYMGQVGFIHSKNWGYNPLTIRGTSSGWARPRATSPSSPSPSGGSSVVGCWIDDFWCDFQGFPPSFWLILYHFIIF